MTGDNTEPHPTTEEDIDAKWVSNAIHILESKIRRELIFYLENKNENEVHVEETLDYLCNLDGIEKNRSQLKIEIFHIHIPKIQEFGIIEKKTENKIKYNPISQMSLLSEYIYKFTRNT